MVKAKNTVGLQTNEAKLKKTQLNFTNFLLGFIMLEEKQQLITEEELDWSMPKREK